MSDAARSRASGPIAARGRSSAVLGALAGASVALIGSTQTWLTATVADAALPVSGAEAVPVLQPLTLAALALSLVLTLVGRVLRYVLGAIAVAVGGTIAWISGRLAADPTPSAAVSVVTEHTGIAGADAVSDLVTGISLTPWPAVSVVAGAVVVLAGVWTLATAHAWRRSGRRYENDGGAAARAADEPLDAVDSWDGLSRGDDPTR
ncbi:Trp biosynthesis-associated membrane protein [Microbacterium betulae]|uniref:Trp biosynthesis-associated membrane protein n=1 Tax=Microbacterium betulae TaxID=2981139 RepID=A0AA97FDE5_9MICO|nr:Trp biosynthesis-associated membrane protein [Microbacterium sp. AB]WOF21506.1 Trp biosynthesis-associated membrane protein [Microbacterium sp. AB]